MENGREGRWRGVVPSNVMSSAGGETDLVEDYITFRIAKLTAFILMSSFRVEMKMMHNRYLCAAFEIYQFYFNTELSIHNSSLISL